MTNLVHVLIFENDKCEGCGNSKAIGIHGYDNKLDVVMACDCDPHCASLVARLSDMPNCQHFMIVEDSAAKTIADMLLVLPEPDLTIRTEDDL